MKCVLAMPEWSLSETHTKAMSKSVAGVWPPPGLLSIAAVLREAGHDVTILDGTLLSQTEIICEIEKIKPGLLGIYSVGLLWPMAQDLANQVKKKIPKIFTLVGGPHPSYFKEKCIKECPSLDAVCVGEGEYTVRELAGRLEKGEDLEECQGLILNTEHGIIHNSPRPLIENFDELPYYALDLVEMHRYRPPIGHFSRLPVAQMMSSRGCPNSCLYCYKVCGDTIRLKSAKRVVDEMEHYVTNFGAREIKFWDDLFTYDGQRVHDICNEIKKRKLKVTWMVASRIDTVDEAMLKNMAEAGCWCILYGIETAVEKNQEMLRKNLDLSRAKETIRLTHKYGIKSYATFILGIPGETYDEGIETIQFAKDINAYFTEFFTFTPFPGSPVYEEVNKHGVMDQDLCNTGMHLMGFIPYSMTSEELSKLCTLAYKSVYLRPKYVIRQFLSIRSLVDLSQLLRGAVAISNMILGKHHKAYST